MSTLFPFLGFIFSSQPLSTQGLQESFTKIFKSRIAACHFFFTQLPAQLWIPGGGCVGELQSFFFLLMGSNRQQKTPQDFRFSVLRQREKAAPMCTSPQSTAPEGDSSMGELGHPNDITQQSLLSKIPCDFTNTRADSYRMCLFCKPRDGSQLISLGEFWQSMQPGALKAEELLPSTQYEGTF